MTDSGPDGEEVLYKILLLSPDPRFVLVLCDSDGISLPRITIPNGARPALNLQRRVRSQWNLNVFLVDFLHECGESVSCAVMRLLAHHWPEEFIPISLEQVPASELTIEERKVAREMAAGQIAKRGPFSRITWMDELIDWLKRSSPENLATVTEIEQYNAGAAFALVHICSDQGSSYWVKAVGEPNLHEFSITATLANLCPQVLPPILAMRSDWHAWVMEDAGEPLPQVATIAQLKLIALALAKMERTSAEHLDELLGSGAHDQQPSTVRKHIPEIFAYLERAMDGQTSLKAARIARPRLQEIGNILADACSAVEELGIPNSILHNDLNQGNILLSTNRCVLIDWCEASIGNPFIGLQHILLLAARNSIYRQADLHELREIFKGTWSDCLSPETIERSLILTPLLAIASYLHGRGDWTNPERGRGPRFESYARSLARHMDRAAQDPLLLEALCR